MSKIAESFNKVCELVQQKNQVGFGFTSPQAKELETALDSFEEGIVNAGVIPEDWTHKSSIGKGNLASVMWVVFLPPGQTTQDGIYISLCFGRMGNGLVTGCAISNTSKRKYGYVPTVERKNPVIDVDGTRQGTHYNNGFVNPLEVGYNTLEEGGFLAHLQKSVEVCNQCLSMKGGSGMSESAKERHELWQKFLERWPASKIEGMSLDDYTSFGGDRQSFSNWLEVHTDALGSIWGGSAYKFGVFKANPSSKVVSDSTHDGDGTYKWYKRYGRTAAEALEYVKQTFAHIATSVASKDLAAIDKVDFGHAVTWKIAFLYQSEENPIMVPIYNKKMLCALTGMPNDTPTSALQQKLMADKPFDQDIFDYYDDLLERLPADEENEESIPTGAQAENKGEGEMAVNHLVAEHKAYDRSKGRKWVFDHNSDQDQLMLRILASLRTKPFVILAGHSGTGKSRMVKKLAYMTCRDNKLHEGSDPGNYCIIEVKPNWHDSTELLGYFSSFGHDHYVTKQLVEFIMKAYAYPDVPFFVCLDEMNLAPVEQYFAEFLSALEDIHVDEGKMNAFFGLNDANKPDGGAAQEVVKYTSAPLIKPIDYKDDIAMLEPKTTQAMDWLKTHGLTIPKNLFVVGTVNMDESTNQFSRKVLDRAFTIEMTDARFEDFGDEDKDPLPTFAKEDEIDHALIDNLLTGKKQAGKLSTRGADTAQPRGQLENMNDLKGVLAGTPFVVAYRFANEYALYEDALNVLDVLADGASETDKAAKKAANAKRAFDDAVLMKLLPRIAGERAVVAEIFEGRKATDKRGEKDGLLKFLEYDKEQKKGTASGEKMTEILNRGNVPYLTFWP